MTTRPRHTRTLIICLLALTSSIILTICAVPLYNLLCKHLGITNPTILTGPSAPQENLPATYSNANRVITVRFTANTQAGVPLTFHPLTYTMRVPVGQPVLTAYAAKNLAPQGIDGVAVHMLYAMGGAQDVELAPHISLQQCFCFAQQHYPANTEIRLPLSFTILPSLPEGVHTITFAYTLFRALPNDPRIKEVR